jgi:hypothetical protein
LYFKLVREGCILAVKKIKHENNPKFDKRRAFKKAVGPGKKYKINKRRAYVYSGI